MSWLWNHTQKCYICNVCNKPVVFHYGAGICGCEKEIDKMTIIDMLSEMATVNEPWELFDPVLRYGKVSGEGWQCYMHSTCGPMTVYCGNTPEKAVRRCYNAWKHGSRSRRNHEKT